MTTSSAGVVLDEDGYPLDRVRLTGLAGTGHHGVLDHERMAGQVFRADVVMHCDTRRAALEDDIEVTADYGRVAQAVVEVLAGPPVDLIETLAERVAARVLEFGPVIAVDVTVHKPQAPIPVPFDDVEVTIHRDRLRVPVVPSRPETADMTHVISVPELAPDVVAPVEAAPVAFDPVSHVEPEPVPVDPAPPVPVAVALPAVAEQPPVEVASAPEPVETEAPAPRRDRMDETPDGFVDVVLALGGNLGDIQETLRDAVTDLDRVPGLEITDVSPLARSAAVGEGDQPDYLNAVLLARTQLSARDLLRACLAVEAAHGRVRGERWAPRTLDIDIVVYGNLTDVTDDLELPHPRAHERSFVLEPWSQVDPDAILPGLGGGPVAALAETAPDRDGIRWLALDWLTEPAPATGTIPAREVAQAVEPEAYPAAPEPYAPVEQPPVFAAPPVETYVPEVFAPGVEPMNPAALPPAPVTGFAPVEQPPVFTTPEPVVPAAPAAPAAPVVPVTGPQVTGAPVFPSADEVFPGRTPEDDGEPGAAPAFPFAPVDGPATPAPQPPAATPPAGAPVAVPAANGPFEPVTGSPFGPVHGQSTPEGDEGDPKAPAQWEFPPDGR